MIDIPDHDGRTPPAATRLLLADGHSTLPDGIVRLFEHEPDIEVVARCADGAATLRAVHEHRPNVILLDLRLPPLGGVEVLRRLTREGAAVRTVVLAANMTGDDLLEAIRFGVRGVVSKEVTPELLVHRVQSVHDGVRWLDPELEDRAIDRFLAREADRQRAAKVLAPPRPGWSA